MADIDAILIQRLFQSGDLGVCNLDFRLSHLLEIPRSYIAGEKADNDHHDQEFKQRKAI